MTSMFIVLFLFLMHSLALQPSIKYMTVVLKMDSNNECLVLTTYLTVYLNNFNFYHIVTIEAIIWNLSTEMFNCKRNI